MENEGMMEAEARLLQKNNTDDPRNMDVQTSQAVDAFAAGPVNEETALLGAAGKRRDSQPESPAPPNPWYDPQFEGLPWYQKPGIYWIIFPFLSVTLAFGGIIVTKLVLIEDLLCAKYFSSKVAADPNFTFMPIVIGDENKQCDIPAVSSLTAEFMLISQLLSGIPCAILAPFLGAYSDRWGRTRILAVTAVGSLLSEILTIVVAKNPQMVSVYWLLLGSFFEGLTGSYIVSMAVANAYISDCTPPPQRARAMSFIYGCLFGGIALGPIISAKLVEVTQSIIAPFYLTLGVHSLYCLFMLLVVPESIPHKRLLAARAAWQESKLAAGPTTQWQRFLSLPKALRILWPKGPGSSSLLRRNLVMLAAVDTVCFGVAMGAITVILVYTRQAFSWDHSTTQYYVSIVNICRVTALLLVLPALNRLFRGKSTSDHKQGHTGADNVDLGFIRAGILFDTLGFVGFAAATHGSVFTISGAVTAAGGIVGPTLTSAMTRHMPAHLTGQLLGAIGLLHALARIIAPAVFNSIFAATASTFPQAVFVCLACAFGIGAGLSWFIKPNVYYDESLSMDESSEQPSSTTEQDTA